LGAAIGDFQQQTGKILWDCSLLRVPPRGYPWHVGLRVFVNQRLHKIGERMWNMPPEKDSALIAKLQTSKYDTANQNTNTDKELNKERKDLKTNRTKIEYETRNYINRNRNTDWGVVK
jgi:hypothetical protein